MSNWSFNLEPKKVLPVNTKWRTIQTSIPVPESIPYFHSLDKTESFSMHGQMPIVWDKAEGCQVSDPWGNTWLDFTSTIFVANAGHGNPDIIAAIRECLDKPLLHTYSYVNAKRVNYLEKLLSITPENITKAFLLSAGTEATECALKLMRLYAQKQNKKRPCIICFEGNWHGRTMGAQMLSYNPAQKEWIGYHDPHILHLPFPYPWNNIDNPADFFHTSFEALCEEHNLNPEQDIAGFMLETFQGWAAAFYPVEFVKAIRAKADSIGALLAFDEMQSGFGRTGKLFGYEHYGVTADVLCCGKGISSSLPLSAVLGSTEVMDLPGIGSMSSTHSANPLCCAAALASLEYTLKHNLIERSAVLGELLFAQLNAVKEKYPEYISHVLGNGLLAGVHFNNLAKEPLSALASRVCELAMQKGLILVHTGRESIKIGPPLTIPEDALLEGCSVFAQCVEQAIEEQK